MGIIGNIMNVLSGESDTFNTLWGAAMEEGNLEEKVNSIVDTGVKLVLEGGSSAEDITQFLANVHAPEIVKFMNDFMPGSSIVSEIDNALYNIMAQDLDSSRSMKDARIAIELWDQGVNLYENEGMADYKGGYSDWSFTEEQLEGRPDLIAQYLGMEPVSLNQVDRPTDAVLKSLGLDPFIKGGENWYSIDEWRFGKSNLVEHGIIDIQNYFTPNLDDPSVQERWSYHDLDQIRNIAKDKENTNWNKPTDLGWLTDDYFNKLTKNFSDEDWWDKIKQVTRFDLLEHELNMFQEAGWVNLSSYDNTSPILNEIFDTIYGGQGLDISTYTKVLRYDDNDDKYYFEVFDMWDFGENYKKRWGNEDDMSQAAWDVAIDFVDAAGSPINMYDKYEIPKADIEYLINSAKQKAFD